MLKLVWESCWVPESDQKSVWNPCRCGSPPKFMSSISCNVREVGTPDILKWSVLQSRCGVQSSDQTLICLFNILEGQVEYLMPWNIICGKNKPVGSEVVCRMELNLYIMGRGRSTQWSDPPKGKWENSSFPEAGNRALAILGEGFCCMHEMRYGWDEQKEPQKDIEIWSWKQKWKVWKCNRMPMKAKRKNHQFKAEAA